MSIEFRCLKCQKLLRVPDTSAGKMARCPDCGEVQTVPAETSAAGTIQSEATTLPPATPKATPTNPFGEPAVAASGNPFGDSSNPYAATSTTTTWQPLPEDYARARVETPAITLAVLAGITLALHALSLVGSIITAFVEAGAAMEDLVFQLIGALLVVAIYGTVLAGALKMRRLQNYPLSVAAAILAILPCGACCIVGLPVGIWALVVLSDRSVRAAFR